MEEKKKTMNHQPKLHTTLQKKLALTFRMQQALTILQMPQIELGLFIQEEIDKNPLLEEIKTPKKSFPIEEIAASESIYEHITKQIHENFVKTTDREIGEKLLEFIDEKGFFTLPIEEIADLLHQPISLLEVIVESLQTLNPPGIFARNLQESLLLQLKAQGSQDSHAFTLIQQDYHNLLHGRYGLLKKKWDPNVLGEAIQKLALLQLRPLDSFRKEILCPITADLSITPTQAGWLIEIADEELPKFQLITKYESLTLFSKEERETMQGWTAQAKSLLNAIDRRKDLLIQIGLFLARHQEEYLLQKGSLKPVSSLELAQHLNLHESTISRAFHGKYVKTPLGLFPLKYFFASYPEKKDAKKLIEQLIAHENKECPLTDENLAEALTKEGHKVARRTIAKYRQELKIPPMKHRKTL